MKRYLYPRFYQRYFRAVQSSSKWLAWFPQQYRVQILNQVMQWDIDEMDEEKYRQHT